MGKYFGTDGFRGEAGEILTAQHAFRIGRFLGHHYTSGKGTGKIVIGKDTRRSSYMFEYALAAGITASGGDVYLLHVTTTPSISYVVRTEDFDCGIMISASHNPFHDNGIKLIGGTGEKLGGELIRRLEAYLDEAEDTLPFAVGEKIGRTVDYVVGRNRYIGYLISLSTHSFKDLRIGLDVSNGSSWEMAKNIFNALGARTYVINNEPNGFNINSGCGATHVQALQELVRENGLDMGFAFDGDADRCIAVDETGAVISGDRILYIFARCMAARGELPGNAVAATEMSNFGLMRSLGRCGIGVSVTEVGDRFVYERMLEEGYALGGEKTGHIILAKFATTGDGILTAIKLTEAALEWKKKLSELSEGYEELPQIQQNVRVYDKNAVLADEEVLSFREAVAGKLGGEGRIVLRKSGTEPVVRVLVEAADRDACRRYIDELVSVIDRKGYIDRAREASSDGVF
ncbi:phosphoglucosamine mutase [Lachnoclostridium sp. Marseille-P6806]|uniref:phosphoglucosamine mutase n=1 Tax=Lachnoclostridium sp. Marseille-P6806 TaxID=2364793 RepID=UPI00102F5A22|nr:phosphoglucosamine mutase [Lachnoclostridium sp. Marseille-P6806]